MHINDSNYLKRNTIQFKRLEKLYQIRALYYTNIYITLRLQAYLLLHNLKDIWRDYFHSQILQIDKLPPKY